MGRPVNRNHVGLSQQGEEPNILPSWDTNFEQLVRKWTSLPETEEIVRDTRLMEAGVDSIAAVQLIFDIEDLYGITIDASQLTALSFDTAGELWDSIFPSGGAGN